MYSPRAWRAMCAILAKFSEAKKCFGFSMMLPWFSEKVRSFAKSSGNRDAVSFMFRTLFDSGLAATVRVSPQPGHLNSLKVMRAQHVHFICY